MPTTLGEAASRMQDLIFAAQSRRTLEYYHTVHDGDEAISLTVVRIAYGD